MKTGMSPPNRKPTNPIIQAPPVTKITTGLGVSSSQYGGMYKSSLLRISAQTLSDYQDIQLLLSVCKQCCQSTKQYIHWKDTLLYQRLNSKQVRNSVSHASLKSKYDLSQGGFCPHTQCCNKSTWRNCKQP